MRYDDETDWVLWILVAALFLVPLIGTFASCSVDISITQTETAQEQAE